MAPAPTEEIDTSTPSAAPVATVRTAVRRASSRPSRSPKASTSWRRKISAPAVTNSATPSTTVINWLAAAPLRSSFDSAKSVAAVIGTLPAASRPTMRQLMEPIRPCATVPAVLVAAA